MPDITTTNQSYPRPHPDNTLQHDVTRISNAIEMIDQDMAQTQQQANVTEAKTDEKLRRVRLNTLLNENIFMI